MADSSFLVSFFLPGDSNQGRAIALMEDNEGEIVLVPDTVMFETLTVLSYKGGPALAKEAYGELSSSRQVRTYHFTERERDEILEGFAMLGKRISVTDFSVVYLAKRGKCGVLCFDSEIKKLVKS